jgi:pimeloyl-ACP methyl ester carboxylesterase
MARRLVESGPGLGARLVDLRLHGGSTDASPPHTLKACADDLRELGGAPGVEPPDVLVGHSFGGKVVLQAVRPGEGPFQGRRDGPDSAWVVDVSPSSRGPGGDAVRMLRALREEAGPFADREGAVEALRGHGFPPSVGRWMATNLGPADGGLRWGLDLDGIEALLEDFFRTDLWDVVEAGPEGPELHLVKAEGSEAFPDEDVRRAEQAAADRDRLHVHRLDGDHWLNVSNPDGLLETMQERMPR